MEVATKPAELATNIYDTAYNIEDMMFIVISLGLVSCMFLIGFVGLAYVIRKVCGND